MSVYGKRGKVNESENKFYEPRYVNTVLVLNILPLAAEHWQTIGSSGTSTVCNGVAQHKLASIAMSGDVVGASASD
jgi:hypothetical protein